MTDRTHFQNLIRADLEARKKRIEDMLSMENLDKIIAYGEKAGMIKEQGIILSYDIKSMQYEMAKSLYTNGCTIRETAAITGLNYFVVSDIAGHVNARIEQEETYEHIKQMSVPGAFDTRFSDTQLSSRVVNTLRMSGFTTVADLVRNCVKDVKTIDGFGAKSCIELSGLLEELKVQLKG